MLKNTYLFVPAVLGLCLTLGGCNNESETQTTGQSASAVAEAQQDAAPIAPAPNTRSGEVEANTRGEQVRRPQEIRGDRDNDAIRAAREAAIAERADRAARAEAARAREAVIALEPRVLDVGQMPTGERRSGTIKLTNTSDTLVRLVDSRTSCGCTVANVPKNHDMAPGESIEVEVTLAGSQRAERLTKNVTFIFEDHPNLVAQVTGETIAYVTLTPNILDPEQHADGRVVIRSTDGEAFRIVSITPVISLDVPEETSTEHVFHISWEEWAELHQPRRLSIELDHPNAQRVVASIRAPRTAAAHERDPHSPHAQVTQRTRAQQNTAPLHELAQTGNTEALVERLQDDTADINSVDQRGMNLLGIAARHGHIEMMRALIDAGANVNHVSRVDGRTPLMTAVESKKADTVRLLLEAGADVHARDTNFGTTALSWGSLVADRTTIQLLLDAGADTNVANRATGWTPLHTAVGFNDEKGVVDALIDAGGNIEATCTIQGFTPLMYAAMTGRMENLNTLLNAGANVNAKDPNGRSTLLVAAGSNSMGAEGVKALLDAGADLTVTDVHGQTALDLARLRNDPLRDEVVALLEPLLQNE